MGRWPLILALLGAGWAGGWFSHQWSQQPRPPSASNAPSTTPPHATPAAPPAPLPEPSPSLDEQLKQGQYERALARLKQAPEARRPALRQQLLAFADALRRKQQPAAAETLLKVYLRFEFRNVDALRRLAEARYDQGRALEALETLYTAKGYAHRGDTLAALSNEIRRWSRETAMRYADRGDHAARVALYETLTRLEPDYPPHFIGLAQARIAAGDPAAARSALALVRSDPDVGGQARQLLARLEDGSAPDGTTDTVALERRGNAYGLRVRLNQLNDVVLLLDTGASMTAVKPERLFAAGVTSADREGYGWFNTANGRTRAPIYRVGQLTLGQQTLENIQVAALEGLSGLDVDGLLGMNALDRYHFFIDQRRNLLHLQSPS